MSEVAGDAGGEPKASDGSRPPIAGGALLPLLLLAAVALAAGLPLLGPVALAGHDAIHHLNYAHQTSANAREGILLPAWSIDFNAGFGGPGLLFYQPVAATANSLFHLSGLPLPRAVSVATILALLLSGLAAYLWLREQAGASAAVTASVVYMIAPYRLINIYERTALGEHWAFIWPPLILWALTSRRLSTNLRLVIIALATAGMVLSNVPLAGFFGAVIFAYALRSRTWTILVALGMVLGFAMAGFMTVPQMFASRWLQTEIWFGNDASVYRTSMNTLFNPGAIYADFNTRVSLGLLATAAVAIVAVFAGAKRFWVVTAAIACVAMTAPFGKLWDLTPVIQTFQFPWRLGSVITLAAAAAISGVTSRRAALVLSLVVMAAAVPYAGRSLAPLSLFGPDGLPGNNPKHARMVDIWLVPRTVPGTFMNHITRSDRLALGSLSNAVAVIQPATADMSVARKERLRRVVQYEAPQGGLLVWRSFLFPGMSVTIDGRETDLLAHSETGFLATKLPPGRHLVEWRWEPFREMRIGRAVSLIAASFLLVLAATDMVRRRLGGNLTGPESPG